MSNACKIYSDSQSLILAKEVRTICAPFFKDHAINSFSYSKVFLDGSRAELWSDADALHHSFVNKKYIANTYTPDNYKEDDRYIYLPSKIEGHSRDVREQYKNQLNDQRNIFGYDHCFLIINKCENFCEYFIFYTPPTFTSAINFYFNNLEKLEQFAKEFKDHSQQLIKTVEKDRIILPWRTGGAYKNSAQLTVNYRKSEQHIIHLTLRERQVVRHLLEGKTAKQIALLLDLSPRTVESYLATIKDKYMCNKSSDLIVKLLSSDINLRDLFKNE